MNVERPRGTRDFTPIEMQKRQYLEGALRKVASRFNYQEVSFPAFEHTQLFQLKSGEEIGGHMYVFEDKGGRSLCLRPEATASVARMYGSSLRSLHKPVKVYYMGPMYRYEEPQKNRYREFWQFGFELIGTSSRDSDAEVIALAAACLDELGLKYNLRISHLGVIRSLLTELGLKEGEQDKVIALLDRGKPDEVKKTIKEEVLFKLIELKGKDSLSEAKKILEEHPGALEKIIELEETTKLLSNSKINFEVNLGMARGLAYYTGMVFEVRVEGLGAQDQVCGGGRYDNLIKLFSGIEEPAVGFAFGFDRLLDALETQGIEFPAMKEVIVVAAVNDEAREKAFEIASKLREKAENRIELDLMGRKLKKTLEYASKINACKVVIVGMKELKEGKVVLRDMVKNTQSEVKLSELENQL